MNDSRRFYMISAKPYVGKIECPKGISVTVIMFTN